MNALITEVDRISSATTWAGESLMTDADGKTFYFQVGTAIGNENQIGVTIDAMSSSALGLGAASTINVDFDLTTGGFGPTVQHAISMGYINTEFSEVGTTVFAEIRGKRMEATIIALPFTPPNFKR